MKRKAIVATLSLVMCLFMAFPASAFTPQYPVYDKTGIQSFYDYVIVNSIFRGYSYQTFFKQPSSDSYYAFCFKTSTPKKNDLVLIYVSATNGNHGLYRGQTNNTFIQLDSYSNSGGDFNRFKTFITNDGSELNFPCTFYFFEISNVILNIPEVSYRNLYSSFIPAIPPVDTSALESLLSQAEATQNTGYTQSSLNALQFQISAAENLLSTTGYTQPQVDSAKNSLQSALDGLVLLPTTPDLTALLSESNVIGNNGYTPETWTRFTNARNAAHALLLSADYNQIELDSVYYELSAAINGLTLEVIKPPDPPKPPQKPLGYDLSTGDISGYLNVVPRIFYNYVLSAKDIGLLIFGIVLAILLIPRILSVIIPNLRR